MLLVVGSYLLKVRYISTSVMSDQPHHTSPNRGFPDPHRLGYVEPRATTLTRQQIHAMLKKTYEEKIKLIEEKYEAKDNDLDDLRFKYTRATDRLKAIREEMTEKASEAIQYARSTDNKTLNPAALMTRDHMAQVSARFLDSTRPQIRVKRRPHALDDTSAERSPRLTPRKGYAPSGSS